MEHDIRVLTPDDYDVIIGVWKSAGLPHRPKGRDSREEIIRQMALDPEMFLGCFIGENMVGVVIGSYDQRKGWINRLAVVPEHRKKGIARALVRRIEEVLRRKGFMIIATLVEAESLESEELFSDAGYVKHEDIHYYTKREDKEV